MTRRRVKDEDRIENDEEASLTLRATGCAMCVDLRTRESRRPLRCTAPPAEARGPKVAKHTSRQHWPRTGALVRNAAGEARVLGGLREWDTQATLPPRLSRMSTRPLSRMARFRPHPPAAHGVRTFAFFPSGGPSAPGRRFPSGGSCGGRRRRQNVGPRSFTPLRSVLSTPHLANAAV